MFWSKPYGRSRPPLYTVTLLQGGGVQGGPGRSVGFWPKHPLDVILSQNGPQKRVLRRKLGLETVSSGSENFVSSAHYHPMGVKQRTLTICNVLWGDIHRTFFNPRHDFKVKNGSFQSLFPRFRVISAYSTGRASHSDHFSGQVSMATILQDFYLFRRGFQHCTRDHLPDEG